MRADSLWLLVLLAPLVACEGNEAPNRGLLAPSEAPDGSGPPALEPPAHRPMLIAFTRDFCLPCHKMAPWVVQVRREQAGVVDVVEVNLDRENNARYALFFGIASVPTQVYVDAAGRIAAVHDGVASKEEMGQLLRGLAWTR